MKFLLFVVVVAGAWMACGSKREVPSAQAVGGTAVSRDGALSYILNPDEDTVTIVQRKNKRKLAEVRVGKAPEQIAVAPDDTLYIANRGSRSVSLIRPGQWEEAGRIAVGLEPVALVVAPDNRTLYIVNGSSLEKAENGSLMAVDLSTQKVRWELPVIGAPRGIALVDANTARIDRYRSDEPLWVKLSGPEILGAATSAASSKLHAGAAVRAREGRAAPRPFPSLHASMQ